MNFEQEDENSLTFYVKSLTSPITRMVLSFCDMHHIPYCVEDIRDFQNQNEQMAKFLTLNPF